MDPTVLKQLKDELGIEEICGAIDQLEGGRAETIKQLTELTLRSRRGGGAFGGSQQWRGPCFESEGDARGFGLLVMARCAKNERALDALKSEHHDVYEHAMATDPDASGGALIPPEFSRRIQLLVEQYGVFDRNAYRMPMESDSLLFIKQTGELTVYLLSENTAGTSSDPTFANIALAAKEWGTLSYFPRGLSEDAAPEVGEIVAKSIARAFAEKMDKIGFLGDGTSTYFGIVGLCQRLINVNGVDDGGGLVLGDGNAFSELTLANHDTVMGVLPQYAAADAQWYVSRKYFLPPQQNLWATCGSGRAPSS